jgi:hypothetical protein
MTVELNGAGKYDDECKLVRMSTRADSVLVMVYDGDRGTGFSVQASASVIDVLPEILESMAAEIRKLRDV